MKRIFISYAREDADVARRLYADLRDAGLSPWMDINDLIPGQAWKEAVEAAIRDSSYFLALISKHSISKRGFIQKELRIALDGYEEVSPADVFLIPVRLEDVVPAHRALAELQWVDLWPSYADALKKILVAMSATTGNITGAVAQDMDGPDEEPGVLDLRVDLDEGFASAMEAIIAIAEMSKANERFDLEWKQRASDGLSAPVAARVRKQLVNELAQDFRRRAHELVAATERYRRGASRFFDGLEGLIQYQVAAGVSTPTQMLTGLEKLEVVDECVRNSQEMYVGILRTVSSLASPTLELKRQKRAYERALQQFADDLIAWSERSAEIRRRIAGHGDGTD